MESLPCWENGAPVVAVCLTVRGPGISCPPPKFWTPNPSGDSALLCQRLPGPKPGFSLGSP